MSETGKTRLPGPIMTAVAEGKSLLRAYREFLGYSVDEMALTCGLTSEEIEKVEAGHRYGRGYRARIARAMALPMENLAPEK